MRETGARARGRSEVAVAPAVAGAGRGKCFACLCEDVTSKDIGLSIDEGYDSIELAKRYTTVTMGPCQGRMCQLPAVRLMAQDNGSPRRRRRHHRPSAVGGGADGGPRRPAVRAGQALVDPLPPPRAGGERQLGGRLAPRLRLRRPEGEALAVNHAAGLIDVSTLGKLLVRGADAGEFLDRLYPNRFSDLKPGRIRYGVISSDAGRIVDDGTICRLDEETFYVTTTSSGAGAVEQWFAGGWPTGSWTRI